MAAHNGAKPVDRHIVALGRLEPAGGVLAISAIPGDVLKSFGSGVEEGAIVEAGSVLALVNSYNLRATQLEAATTKLELGKRQRNQEIAVAEANQQQALASQAEVKAKLEEIEAQGDALGSIAEAARIAQTDYEKLVELRATDPDLVTELQLRRKRNQADQAGREYDVPQRSHDAAAHRRPGRRCRRGEERFAGRPQLEASPGRRSQRGRRDREESCRTNAGAVDSARAEDREWSAAIQDSKNPAGARRVRDSVSRAADRRRDAHGVHCRGVRSRCQGDQAGASGHHPQLGVVGRVYDYDGRGDGVVSGGIAGKVVRVGSLVSSGGLIQRNPLAPSDRSIIEVLIAIDPKDVKATAEAAAHIGMQVTVYFGKQPAVAAAKAASPVKATDATAPKVDDSKSP